jgi:hypothetical protein
MLFFKHKCFLFLFIFIATTPCAHETPAIPHPPRLQMRAGGGVFTLHTTNSQPHPPRSQTRARGGFTHNHTTSPSSLASASRGWVYNHHHPTLLARKREPMVGLLSTTTTTTPLSSLANASRGWGFLHPPATAPHPPSLLANASRGWVFITYRHNDNGAHKCELGVGGSLSTFQPPQPHPPRS